MRPLARQRMRADHSCADVTAIPTALLVRRLMQVFLISGTLFLDEVARDALSKLLRAALERQAKVHTLLGGGSKCLAYLVS